MTSTHRPTWTCCGWRTSCWPSRCAFSGLGWPGRGSGSSPSLTRLAQLEEAESDLVLLVRRMSSSPLGPFLRLRGEFRTLEERYLSPEAQEASSRDRLAYLELAEQD